MIVKRYYHSERKDPPILLIAFIILFILILFMTFGIQFLNRKTEILTVIDKEISIDNKRSTYLIYTRDEENQYYVLKNTDNFLALKFNSSDIYAGLEIGKTYKFEIGGYRIPMLSQYPNIFSYEPLE